MKIANYLYMVVLALVCQPTAFALEASTAVKASVILKADTSWDDKPITYPEG